MTHYKSAAWIIPLNLMMHKAKNLHTKYHRFLQRVTVSICNAERCISYDRFCPTVCPTVRPSSP